MLQHSGTQRVVGPRCPLAAPLTAPRYGRICAPNSAGPSTSACSPLASTAAPQRREICQAASTSTPPSATPFSLPTTATGKLISSTEVPAFIQRDDMIDQLYHWSVIEAGEGGFRNFGMPMTVEPMYRNDVLWGFTVGMYKDGIKLTDIGIGFDNLTVDKHEWVGRGEDGFPVNEGKVEVIDGRNIEIWKLDLTPVSEDLRATIRAFCTGLVSAVNRYYSFGSVFVDDERG